MHTGTKGVPVSLIRPAIIIAVLAIVLVIAIVLIVTAIVMTVTAVIMLAVVVGVVVVGHRHGRGCYQHFWTCKSFGCFTSHTVTPIHSTIHPTIKPTKGKLKQH